MPFGLLTNEMEALVAPHVERRIVWDLGAGDLMYAHRLLKLGAAHVVAVDKELPQINVPPNFGLTIRQSYFHEIERLDEDIEVAFMSWPRNGNVPGLARMVDRSRVVVYLGSNTDGSACGDVELFLDHLCHRELLGHVPHRRNSLLIYGRPRRREKPLTGEEFAMLSGNMMPFETAQQEAAKQPSRWL